MTLSRRLGIVVQNSREGLSWVSRIVSYICVSYASVAYTTIHTCAFTEPKTSLVRELGRAAFLLYESCRTASMLEWREWVNLKLYNPSVVNLWRCEFYNPLICTTSPDYIVWCKVKRPDRQETYPPFNSSWSLEPCIFDFSVFLLQTTLERSWILNIAYNTTDFRSQTGTIASTTAHVFM